MRIELWSNKSHTIASHTLQSHITQRWFNKWPSTLTQHVSHLFAVSHQVAAESIFPPPAFLSDCCSQFVRCISVSLRFRTSSCTLTESPLSNGLPLFPSSNSNKGLVEPQETRPRFVWCLNENTVWWIDRNTRLTATLGTRKCDIDMKSCVSTSDHRWCRRQASLRYIDSRCDRCEGRRSSIWTYVKWHWVASTSDVDNDGCCPAMVPEVSMWRRLPFSAADNNCCEFFQRL